MAANWWYNLVARKLNLDHVRLVCENKSQDITIRGLTRTVSDQETLIADQSMTNSKLRDEVRRLEQPTPIQSWITGLQTAAAKQLSRNRELETEIAKMGLIRDALRNEKAYTLFLEDCLECHNPSEVFNTLPLEKRKEYFDKAQ